MKAYLNLNSSIMMQNFDASIDHWGTKISCLFNVFFQSRRPLYYYIENCYLIVIKIIASNISNR